MKRTRSFILGFISATVLTTAVSALAQTELIARLSSQTFFWQNAKIELEAYNINAYFSQIHTLEDGDRIQLTTKKGTRTYRVFNVEKISVNDTSNLQGTNENIITTVSIHTHILLTVRLICDNLKSGYI